MEYYLPRIMSVGKGRWEMPEFPPIHTNGVRLFDNIQIQTMEFCNLKCDFCPNHYIIWDRIEDKKRGIPYNLMTVENYTKIVKNLAELGYSGRFSPYLMNEPLMDKDRIVEFIRIAREHLPNCFIQMDSNGTGLTVDLMRDMIDAGLNRIQFDDYFDLDGNFFNTGQEYIWGKQDVEVQSRVGHSIVAGTCYVYHKKQGGWREIRSGLRR